MRQRNYIAHGISASASIIIGAAAFYVLKVYLNQPENLLDWAVLVCSAITVAIVVYVLVWGHFQKEPMVPPNASGAPVNKH